MEFALGFLSPVESVFQFLAHSFANFFFPLDFLFRNLNHWVKVYFDSRNKSQVLLQISISLRNFISVDSIVWRTRERSLEVVELEAIVDGHWCEIEKQLSHETIGKFIFQVRVLEQNRLAKQFEGIIGTQIYPLNPLELNLSSQNRNHMNTCCPNVH